VQDADSIRWLTLCDGDRERLRACTATILGKHPWAAAAYLYGSAARGGPARDVDLGIVAAPLPDHAELVTVGAGIAAALGLDAEAIDVRLLNGGDPVFLGNFLRDAVLLYEADPEQRIRFEVWAMNQWLDFQPVWERMRRQVLTGWSRG